MINIFQDLDEIDELIKSEQGAKNDSDSSVAAKIKAIAKFRQQGYNVDGVISTLVANHRAK